MFWANPGWWGSPVHAAWAGGGGGGGSNPFALIAHTLAITGSNNTATTSAIDTTGANLIVISVSVYEPSAGGGAGVLDNKSNLSWVALTSHKLAGDPYQQIWYCVSPTVGTGHIFTYSGGGTLFGGLAVQAWSGANATQGTVVENGATASAVTSLATGSVTPGASNSLIIAGVSGSSGSSAFTIGSGFTVTDTIDYVGGTNYGAGMAYLKQGAAAAVNPTWTSTGSTNAAAGIAVFKS